VNVVLLEMLAALEERQLDHERDADDLPSELPGEVADRLGCAACCKDVVVNEDSLSCRDCVRMELQGVLAVFERVRGAHGLPGQLPGPSRGHEPAPELVGEHRAEDEPARLGAEDHVRLARLDPVGEQVDRLRERPLVAEQRHDVLEDDPGLREVRDVANLALEVLDAQCEATWRRSRQKSSWESSCATSARAWSSWMPVSRRSGLRERSAGATSWCSKPAFRSAAVRNVRRWRAVSP